MHQTAVIGSQKRLTRCCRELDVASQQHENVAKSENRFARPAGVVASTMATSFTDEMTAFTKRPMVSWRSF